MASFLSDWDDEDVVAFDHSISYDEPKIGERGVWAHCERKRTICLKNHEINLPTTKVSSLQASLTT